MFVSYSTQLNSTQIIVLSIQNPEYRQLLIQTIHVCAIKFSEVAASVVLALMEFLGDSNNPSAVDVIAFVRYVKAHLCYYRSLLINCEYAVRWYRNSRH